jgi:hypothetical protein
MFNKFEDYVQQPSHKRKLEIYSDGNDDYTGVLAEYYNTDCLCYGQKIKSLGIRRKIYGNPSYDEINTNTNECFNTILRNHLSRLVRKSQCHPKQKRALTSAVFVFQFYWNFMHELDKKVTPAIRERQATRVWTWGAFLHKQLSYTY